MSTLITATLPCEEFALAETMVAAPNVSFQCEKIVDTAEGTVLPLVWARLPDDEEILDTALAADSTVTEVQLLSEFDEERLYRMEWVDRQVVTEMLLNEQATILNASTENGQWVLRVLYPTADGPSETIAYCESHGLTINVTAVREMDAEPAGQYGLTDPQYEVLTLACDRGYFAIPRQAELDDLAEELGVSHQALSERLRRGVEALVTDTLLVDQPAYRNESIDSRLD